MLCLIAGASSLQLSGMRAAAPSLLASPQGATRCSLHVMSVVEQLNEKSRDTGHSVIDDFKAIVAKAGEDFKAGQTESARSIESGLTRIGLAIVSAAALLSPSLSIEFKWTFSALGLASAVYGQIRQLSRQRKAKYDGQIVLAFSPASTLALQAPTSPSPR